MEFDVRYDEENDCLIGSFTGRLDSDAIQPYVKEIMNMASNHPCKQLINDLRKAEIDIATLQLYDLPEVLSTFGVDRSWRRALLVSEHGKKDAQFFETVAMNRGYSVRLFVGQDEAIEWLKSGG